MDKIPTSKTGLDGLPWMPKFSMAIGYPADQAKETLKNPTVVYVTETKQARKWGVLDKTCISQHLCSTRRPRLLFFRVPWSS